MEEAKGKSKTVFNKRIKDNVVKLQSTNDFIVLKNLNSNIVASVRGYTFQLITESKEYRGS